MAVAIMAGCDQTNEENIPVDGQPPVAVTFGTGTDGDATRAGYVGEVTNPILYNMGFGIYAYVSRDGQSWATAGSSYKPDFMANQYVSHDNTAGWTYHPVKYWPNEADDYVSFFAYAPYVDAGTLPYPDATTALQKAVADGQHGILSLPTATTAGAPKIAYRVNESHPDRSVDLMYGVAARDYTRKSETAGNGTLGVTAGQPFLNMSRLVVGNALIYNFRHALTRLAVSISARHASADIDTENERVVVDDLALGDSGQRLYTHGVLNLCNTVANQPLWENLDGTVGSLKTYIDNRLRYATGKAFSQQPTGVTASRQSLFGTDIDGTGDAQLFYIAGPVSTTGLPLTVKYHVVKSNGDDHSYTYSVTLDPAKCTFVPGEVTTLNVKLLIP